MKTIVKAFCYKTAGKNDFIDITDPVKKFVKDSKIKNGLVNIQTLHTTTTVIVNENEPLLLEDMKRHLEQFASQKLKYCHDDFKVRTVNMCDNECANGHAHCKAVILGVNVVLNLVKGELQLGQWQRIFFLELDRARERKIQVLILGE